MIDTREAGAGSYPEPPESKEICFNFVIETIEELKGYVWAKDIAEAHQLILDKKWEEIDDGKTLEVLAINELEED